MHDTVDDLRRRPGVDVVVVATPPGVARRDRGRGRCGRDGTCSARSRSPPPRDDLADLVAAADAGPGVLVVDHVLRFNPLLAGVGRLQEELLGAPQRFLFENDASDEDLDDGHWFWDAGLSGGIFVEHGVHFFDAAAMLLGRPATAVQATAAHRAGTGLTDLVSATVRHGDDVLATHTHSFTHAHRAERQLMRLDHGAAETRIEGWIPIDAVVDLWTDDAGVAVCESLPGRTGELLAVDGFRLGAAAGVTVDVRRDADVPAARGRGHDLHVPHHVRVHLTLGGPHGQGGGLRRERARRDGRPGPRRPHRRAPSLRHRHRCRRHHARPRRHPRSRPAADRPPLGRPVMKRIHLAVAATAAASAVLVATPQLTVAATPGTGRPPRCSSPPPPRAG